MGIPLPFSLLYVPSKIMVAGDATATAYNLLANEFIFRAGIVGHLFGATLFLYLVVVLYRLLKSVDESWAKLMVILVVVQVPISFVIEIINFSALMILKGEGLNDFGPAQGQDLSM